MITPAITVLGAVEGLEGRPEADNLVGIFAALLSEEKAQQVASSIKVDGVPAHVVSTTTSGSPIFRVVMGPFPTRAEADKIGRAAKRAGCRAPRAASCSRSSP